MDKKYQFATFFVAAVGFLLGFLGSPIQDKNSPKTVPSQQLLIKARPSRFPPRYSDIRELQKISEKAFKKFKDQLRRGR